MSPPGDAIELALPVDILSRLRRSDPQVRPVEVLIIGDGMGPALPPPSLEKE